ncbi:MAG: 2OG-Fe(II) oxygenase [Planctomycetota bacterium]
MTATSTTRVLRPYDRDQLRNEFRSGQPFPFFKIDGFLDEAFAREVAAAMPGFDEAQKMGLTFKSVNEKLKLQITDSSRFPPPVLALHKALSSPEFLADLSYITGIPNLLADDKLDGGGMHQTGPGGRLDVHVDFNILDDRGWHRRLNILVYLNPEWHEDWGGRIELWDKDVKKCWHSYAPILNRCVVFETSETSYHGVTPLTAPPGVARKSFAAYYYTKEPPAHWDGKAHSTVFQARPDEKFKGKVAMPLEQLSRNVRDGWKAMKKGVKRMLGMSKPPEDGAPPQQG